MLLAKRVSKAVTDGPRKNSGAEAPGNRCSNEHCPKKSLSHVLMNSLPFFLFSKQEVKGFCMGLHVTMEATKVSCSVLLQAFWVGFPLPYFTLLHTTQNLRRAKHSHIIFMIN